jgi:hypothetical protein
LLFTAAKRLAVCFSASRIDTNGVLAAAACGAVVAVAAAAAAACGTVAPAVTCLNYPIIRMSLKKKRILTVEEHHLLGVDYQLRLKK